jgi:cellulose synthase/poly-beta-1,6-N-acetylglucosamine synthase-like glycosyltransferase
MITIILTAYKEPQTIGRAIESILKNKILKPFEILVLAPDKETLEEAKKYTKKHKKIKLIKDEGKGKPAALNLAFKKAKGDILILTDGDVYIGKNAIQLMLEPFKDAKVGIVSGRPISLNSANKMLGYWSHLLTDIAHNMRIKRVKERKMIVCSGYLYAFRKNLIKSVPEEALSEDAVISHLIFDKGYKTAYAGKAEVYVKYPTNFSDWIKQKKRSAGGYNQLNSMVKSKERMRSFTKESSGIFDVLKYPKTLNEFLYTLSLIFARIYLWVLIFIDINIRKRNLKKVWVRIESTK